MTGISTSLADPRPDDSGVRHRLPNTPLNPETKAAPLPTEAPPVPIPSEAHTPIAALWLESRLSPDAPGGYRDAGEDRPFTIRNAKIAIRLVRLIVYRFISLFIKGQEWRMVAYLAGMMSRGMLPTAKLWASSKLLDMVQKSFEPEGVDKNEVIRVAFLSLVFSVADGAVRHVLKNNNSLLTTHIDTTLERAYISTQLSLSIPNLSSPYISALLFEAGIITGSEHPSMKSSTRALRPFNYGAFDAIANTFGMLVEFLDVSSQLMLMYSTLSSGAMLRFGWPTLALIALSISPALLRTLGEFLRPDDHATYAASSGLRLRQQEAVRVMKSSTMRQELTLFGLKDWVMGRWDVARREKAELKKNQQGGHRTFRLGLDIAEESVLVSFYVLLAIRVLPTTLSLGSIRLYQQISESLLSSIRRLSYTVSHVYNTIFFIAAYIEAIDLPTHPHLLRSPGFRDTELLDYESYRVDGGMGLVAKDLSFRYPGSTKDVDILNGINLTIPPGTTLAIVGLNGGGKTTLVKVLMGLFDHEGSLLLNGNELASYDPASVHRRTSCLFQDFCKYSLSLRENVGIGQVGRMGEDDLVGMAIERGGAGGVLEKVGLEGMLNKNGLPKSEGNEAIEVVVLDKKEKVVKLGVGVRFWGQIKGMTGRSGTEMKVAEPVSASKIGVVAKDEIISPADSILPTPELKIEISIAGSPPSTSSPEKTAVQIPAIPILSTPAELDASSHARLSGGQWQRVALSRAFMRASEADLVVFDEPSASLDPEAESLLFAQIHALSHQEGRRCTTIFISHRFATTKKADQIAVVEDGTIKEIGTHAALMELQGRYSHLYNLQARGFDD